LYDGICSECEQGGGVCVCVSTKIYTVTDRPAVLTDWTIRVIDNLANS